jgi:hypothetical protein
MKGKKDSLAGLSSLLVIQPNPQFEEQKGLGQLVTQAK